jgi:hypothetical protein
MVDRSTNPSLIDASREGGRVGASLSGSYSRAKKDETWRLQTSLHPQPYRNPQDTTILMFTASRSDLPVETWRRRIAEFQVG